jgi:hypothetical protein
VQQRDAGCRGRLSQRTWPALVDRERGLLVLLRGVDGVVRRSVQQPLRTMRRERREHVVRARDVELRALERHQLVALGALSATRGRAGRPRR